jgi:hypothetical protein
MSVDRRVRADMQAMGQEVTPDTWAGLEEVRQMADKQRARRNILLAVAAAVVVLVGIAVVPAVGDWWQTSDPAPAAAAPDPEIEQFLDDFWAAWNAYDADAIRAMATADAVMSERDLTATGATSLETKVEDLRADGVYFERVGDPVVRDLGAGIDVVQIGLGGLSDGNEQESIKVLRLVRDDGTLKVEWASEYDYVLWRSIGL